MKPFIAGAIGLLIGLFAGSTSALYVARQLTNGTLAIVQETQFLDQINVLMELKKGNGEAVAKKLEARVLQWAVSAPELLPPEAVNRVLWQVQQLYEKNGITPPEPLRTMLDGLPPRPLTSCEIRNAPQE